MAGRYALLIGNSDFADQALPGLAAPTNDVIALKEVLERPDIAGFETTLLINAGMEEARRAIAALFRDKTADDLVLLYYTGHGLRDDHGDLYLAMPSTTAVDPAAISLEADFVKKQMDRSTSRRQVLILDCCHGGAVKGPGAKDATDQPKLFQTDFNPGGHGRFILAASAANESAFEHKGQSIFTRHLVDGLQSGEAAPEKDEITIHDLHAFVSRRVAAEKAPMQPRLWVDEQTAPVVIARNLHPRRPLPEEEVALLWDKDPYRALGGATRLIEIYGGPDAQLSSDAERVLRERLSKPADLSVMVADAIRAALVSKSEQASELSDATKGASEDVEERVDKQTVAKPNAYASAVLQNLDPPSGILPRPTRSGPFYRLAGYIALCATGVALIWFSAQISFNKPFFPDCDHCPEMVVLEGDTFTMGSSEGEAGRDDDEGPQRQVTVAGFAIGRYPVTFEEWDACVAAGGCDHEAEDRWGRGRMPVVDVSWNDAQEYVAWLSETTGRTCRLPSEAEWEFACRAGTSTAYWWSNNFDPSLANTRESGPGKTTEVGKFAQEPNPWNLHDMSGNVREWVEDHWHSNLSNVPHNGTAWIYTGEKEQRYRVLRGGSWNFDQDDARCANRVRLSPDNRISYVGFRVACSSPS